LSDKFIVVAVISPNQVAQDVIVRALERTGSIPSVWSLFAYPDPGNLKDLPQDADGCVIFLDFSDRTLATAIAVEAQTKYPAIRVVGMLPRPDPSKDLIDRATLTRLAVRDVVGLPPEPHEVLQVLAKHPAAEELLPTEASDGRIFAFLPAKPGAGATTLAVHASAAAARLSGEPTLLIDFDFRLGMTSFLLKLQGSYSVLDALNESGHLEIPWSRLVDRRGKLHVLGSAPQNFGDADPERGAALLLGCARKAYKTIVVDLPGEMREYEIDTLRRATEIFLVCTPDIHVMHMAQRKSEQLQELDLGKKTSVIMNRSGKMGFVSTRDVQSILQLPLRFNVPNAEKEIAEATKAAAALEGREAVVAQIEDIAKRMLPPPEKISPEEPPTRKFLEFFNMGLKGQTGGR
jgi:Flp pilus assembly CpaE family ATPase